MTKSVRAILFDIDGTLVDSNAQHVLAWEEALRREGATFDRQTIHDQIGKGADMLVTTLLPGADEATVQRLGDAQGAIFRARYLDGVNPFPGARELLARARKGGQQAVLASSASRSEVDHYVGLLQARELVTDTTSADEVEHTKPAPDIFAAALKKVAPLGPDQVMVVGDTPYDVEAASKCAIRTIALRSGGFPDHVLQAAGAVAIYDDVAALLADYDHSPLALMPE